MGKQLVIIGADFSAVAIGDAKVLDHIAITTPPTKTLYNQGETFDTTGMVVTAYYTDTTSSTNIGYTYSPTTLSVVGTQTITVSYTKGAVTRTATTNVTVQQGGTTTWTVTPSITNGSAQGVTVADGGTATLTVTPSGGYTNPTSATVTSGTAGTPTVSGNTITITNVRSDITVNAICPSQSGSSINLFPTSISTQLTYLQAKELDNFDSYTSITRAHTEVPDETNNGVSYSVNRGTISDLYYQVIYFASKSGQAANVVAWTAVPNTNVITLPSSEGYYSIVFKDGSAGTGAMWDQPAGSNPNTCKVSVTQQ